MIAIEIVFWILKNAIYMIIIIISLIIITIVYFKEIMYINNLNYYEIDYKIIKVYIINI